MSTGDDLARSKRRRFADAVDVQNKDQDERQRAYYGMLATRLEGLLREIEVAGTSPEDELMKRLRALHSEVREHVGDAETGGE